MNEALEKTLSKVPAVTLGFWLIKIACTTVGETGGDFLSMSVFHADTNAKNGGYLIASAIFLVIFLIAVYFQVRAQKFHPFLYWFVIVATTTLGTTVADFCDRELGAGYFSGMSTIFVFLLLSLAVWYWREGTVRVETINNPRTETYYWVTIFFSQTLGTALGDFTADKDLHGLGLGYEWSALIFLAGLAVVAGLWFWTRAYHAILFWAAFVLTRPLGATLGDFLDKPLSQGGLHLSRFWATTALLVFIVGCVLILPQRAGEHPGERRSPATT